jgi:hypothetical protein
LGSAGHGAQPYRGSGLSDPISSKDFGLRRARGTTLSRIRALRPHFLEGFWAPPGTGHNPIEDQGSQTRFLEGFRVPPGREHNLIEDLSFWSSGNIQSATPVADCDFLGIGVGWPYARDGGIGKTCRRSCFHTCWSGWRSHWRKSSEALHVQRKKKSHMSKTIDFFDNTIERLMYR